MLKLHGFQMSNYYCLAKACLIEKGIEFEEVRAMPSQEDEYLGKSPMGKVPALETPEGFISESFAIAEYLDQVEPANPLLPAEAFLRGKTIELIRHIELDVELVARRCIPAAFFKAKVSEEVVESTKKDLAKGLRAVGRVIVCDPFAAGKDFSLADLYAYYTFGLSGQVAAKILDMDILADLPQVKALMGRLAERESIKATAV